MKILLATKNKGKLQTMLNLFQDLPGFEIFTLDDIDNFLEVEETGQTYQENAFLKAKAYHDSSFDFTIADDSGIEIPVLKDLLGVETRRFGAGPDATDQEWLDYFLDFFKDYTDRQASFQTFICLYDGETPLFFQGKLEGVIAHKQMCEIEKGIPLSSVFIPQNYNQALSQIENKERTKISHRAKALKKTYDYIANL